VDSTRSRTEVHMETQTEPPITRIQMSLADYLELPEKPKAEWVRGETLIMTLPQLMHQYILTRLILLLSGALTDCFIISEAGFRMIDSCRRPDLMVLDNWPKDEHWVDDPPLVAVEVISPSTRNEDMIRKLVEYLAAGVKQYWILDRQYRRITVLHNLGGQWGNEVVLDDSHPKASVLVGNHGTVTLDMTALFAE